MRYLLVALFCLLSSLAHAVTATFVANGTLTHSGSTQTQIAASIGTASANRLVVVVGGYLSAGQSIASATIGGITAAVDVDNNNAGADPWVFFIHAVVPTGTTGDIVITMTGTQFNDGVWSVYTLDTSTINSSTPSVATPVAGGSPLAVTLAGVPANSAVIGETNFNAGGARNPVTTTGYTLDVDPSFGGHQAAFHANNVAGGSTTATTTFVGGETQVSTEIVAWAPAAAAPASRLRGLLGVGR